MAGTTGEFVFTVRRRGTEGFRHSQLKLAAILGVEKGSRDKVRAWTWTIGTIVLRGREGEIIRAGTGESVFTVRRDKGGLRAQPAEAGCYSGDKRGGLSYEVERISGQKFFIILPLFNFKTCSCDIGVKFHSTRLCSCNTKCI